MRFILVLAFLLGCGNDKRPQIPVINCDMKGCEVPEPPKVPEAYDSKLLPFISEFETEANTRNIDLVSVESIEFQDGDLEGSENTLGVCYMYGKRRWIRISSKWWEEMTDIYKRQLIFHEYGHCGLSREHYDEDFKVDGKIYNSIMTTYVSFGYDTKMTKEWPILVDELFNPGKYANANLHKNSVVEHCFVTPEGYTACPISVK